MVQWYSVAQGGRQQPPSCGRYFATTYLNELHDRSMWSIYLELSPSIEEGKLGFLFDTYPQVIKVGDCLPILEGGREVGMMLVVERIR